jgi:hypothetical protein
MSITSITKAPSMKTTAIAVRPYYDPMVSNMGLEKYNLSLWEGVFHEEQLALIEQNGQKRYVTGLNENAPEIKLLPDELRKPRVDEIRKVVQDLERELATNPISSKVRDIPDGVEFWSKVKMLRPDNDALWGKISLRVGNEPLYLDPNDPYDLIKIYAIEAGGFSLVARSYEDAKSRSTPPKFYLDRYQETASTVTELKKIRNRALSELQVLFDSNPVKLMYVAKVVDGNSVQYKKSTPNDVVYNNMDKFITGEGVERNKKRAAQEFLDTSRTDMETLKMRALVKDATFYKYIALKADGFIYHMKSNALLGRTAMDVVEFLKNPLNDQILETLMRDVEKLWNS